MLMYRKDLLKAKGLTMPAQPKYTDIAKFADVLTDRPAPRKMSTSTKAGPSNRKGHAMRLPLLKPDGQVLAMDNEVWHAICSTAYEGLLQLPSRSPAYSSCLSKASVRLFFGTD